MSWAGWIVVGYVAIVSVPLTVIDVREHRLPNRLVVPGIGAALALAFVQLALSAWRDWQPLVCGAGYFALMLVLSVAGGLGMGDVKLAALLGVASGFLGWQACAASLCVAFVLGGLVAGALWLAKRRGRIPFGPFMLAGFWLTTIMGITSAGATG
jgi:leader peptidase (prepilin peptidase)/N-methyltransferase